jgi:hypothetical protein
VDAKKLYADGQGHETPAPMDEIVDVGAFDVETVSIGELRQGTQTRH